VVRFDDLADTEGERQVRVAAFGELDEAVSPPSRVTSLEGLVRGGRRPPSSGRAAADEGPGRVVADGVDRAAETGGRRGHRTAARGGRPGRAHLPTDAGDDPTGTGTDRGGPAGSLHGPGSGTAPAPSAGPAVDDGIPPDAPLPRGRRRGARVGRLGPDAPDPDEPQPEADPVAVAREICLRLLADRARTRDELSRALARKGVPDDAAAAVLDRFDEVGLIDDAAFAEQWVRSRHAYRGLGRRAIAVELRRKGVADDVAGEALAEVDAESEARRARELVDRKLRSLAVDTADQRTSAARRLVGMLARKGYGAGTAYRVVREALAAHGADADELGADAPE
jgi:regulatory protein